MSTKPRAVNRTSTKTKGATDIAGPTRTVKAANERLAATSMFEEQAQKKGVARKPFVDRNNSPEGKGRVAQGTAKGPAKTTLAKPSSALNFSMDNDREPIRVS